MTIQASGAMRTGAIRAEYGGGTPMRLGNYRRGHASLFVRANSVDNGAVNHSAGVAAMGSPLRMSHFYSQRIGWTYTNNAVRVNNYHCHGEFGSDWLGANGTNWPCFYINNNGIYSTSTSYYALVIYGRQNNGPFTFTNNSEIQGAGGQTTGAAGQHSAYIYNSENASYANRPIIINNYAFRGGGGGGGQGGIGGTGGQGSYGYTAQDGPIYTRGSSTFVHYKQGGSIAWGGAVLWSGGANMPTAIANGPYVYYQGAFQESVSDHGVPTAYNYNYYAIYRQYPATAYTSGGGGGAGGAGGRGIGYNSANLGGAGGAGGGAPGTNAGWGGTGGTGGTGGSWGQNGYTGNTGATGQGGNYTGGYAGAGGTGGGPAGYSIYAATKWGLANYNTLNGPYGGGVAPS